MRRHVVVRAAWDAEAAVWYVEERDVPGLATEAATLDELRAKIRIMIPELLEEEVDRPEILEVDLIAFASERVLLAAWDNSCGRTSHSARQA